MMPVRILTDGLSRPMRAVVERDTGSLALELMPKRFNSHVFCNNLDSQACHERRVVAVRVLIGNDTDRSFQHGEVAIVRHETVGVTSMACITGQ